MSKRRRTSLTAIHEFNKQGQHRIVLVCSDGTNKPGDWAEPHSLAQNLNLFASADPSLGLPAGVFTVQSKQHQVLA